MSNTSTRDYHGPNIDTDEDEPMVCNDCGRPTYYDAVDEDYHHAINPAQGCFLIAPDPERPDDTNHPLVSQDMASIKQGAVPMTTHNLDFIAEKVEESYVNVLTLLRQTQWVGSDQDIAEAAKMLADVLVARIEAARDER